MVDQRASHGVISFAPGQAYVVPTRGSGNAANADVGEESGGIIPDTLEGGGSENLGLQPLLSAEAKNEIHLQAGKLGVGQLRCAIVPVCGRNGDYDAGRGGWGGGGGVMLFCLAPRRGVAHRVEIWESSDNELAWAQQLETIVVQGKRKAVSGGCRGQNVEGIVVIVVVEEMVEGGGACHVGCACGGWGQGRREARESVQYMGVLGRASQRRIQGKNGRKGV